MLFFVKKKTDLWEKKIVDLEEQAAETTLTATPGSKGRGYRIVTS